jgi:hypothetical protein
MPTELRYWSAKIPQQVCGGEAQSADYDHPYPCDDVDAALWDRADTAAPSLAAATAQQGVEAEGETRHAHEREQETEG